MKKQSETIEASSVPQESTTYTKSTLLIHVPKTGGTTLSSIFQDHFYDAPQLPHGAPQDLGKYIFKLSDRAYPYIGGHYPLAIVDADRFEQRITILREPIDIISSAISFVHKVEQLPEDVPLKSETEGLSISTYKLFFSTRFDSERYKRDFAAMIDSGLDDYLGECSVAEAIEALKKFTHVFDFYRLDDEIKRFLIEQKFFPYSHISKRRKYIYQPDKERARRSLSSFDAAFYQLGKELFRKVPDDIDTQYQLYRENYCKEKGIKLGVFEGKMIDLRGPIGTGWHTVEQSGDGVSFRWSEARSATVEIPISEAGMYAVILYINPAELTGLKVSSTTTIQPRNFATTLVCEGGVLICQSFISVKSHDWIHISISMKKEHVDNAYSPANDQRELGLVLQAASISRQPTYW